MSVFVCVCMCVCVCARSGFSGSSSSSATRPLVTLVTCEAENTCYIVSYFSHEYFWPLFDSESPYATGASADAEVPVAYAEVAPISFE